VDWLRARRTLDVKSAEREMQRSRDRIALASLMNMTSTYVQNEGKSKIHNNLLVDRIILPFVAFGPVFVSELAIFEGANKNGGNQFTSDLAYARSKGLCFDLNEIYSDEELDAVRKAYSQHDPYVAEFNQAFRGADFLSCATLAEVLIRDESQTLDDLEWSKRWVAKLGEVSRNLGLTEYGVTSPMKSLRLMTDDQIMMLYHRARVRATAFQLEAERRALLALGKKPTAIQLELDLPEIAEQSPEMKVLEIAIPNIGIPRLHNVRDFIDFVSQVEYVGPMRRLRSHVHDLIASDKPTYEISQAIADDS
jgi:hypothetical protein